MAKVLLSNNRIFIEITGAEPTNARWICHFSEVMSLKNNVANTYHEGIPITFTFSDDGVNVEGKYLDRFCGMGGTMVGQYTKQRD